METEPGRCLAGAGDEGVEMRAKNRVQNVFQIGEQSPVKYFQFKPTFKEVYYMFVDDVIYTGINYSERRSECSTGEFLTYLSINASYVVERRNKISGSGCQNVDHNNAAANIHGGKGAVFSRIQHIYLKAQFDANCTSTITHDGCWVSYGIAF